MDVVDEHFLDGWLTSREGERRQRMAGMLSKIVKALGSGRGGGGG